VCWCDTRTSLNGVDSPVRRTQLPGRCLSQPRCLYEKFRNLMLYDTVPTAPDKNAQRLVTAPTMHAPRFRQILEISMGGPTCDLRSMRKSITVHISATQLRAKERCDARKGTSVDSLCVLP
jgi:hypothetical protein